MTVYGLHKLCFEPSKSEKTFCMNGFDFSVMPRFTENQRVRDFDMLQDGLSQNIVLDILVFIATRYSHW